MRASAAKTCRLILACLCALAASGCGKKPKSAEITTLQRKEAANLASEAQFALTLRDHARAEGLFLKAAELCPDTGEYALILGQTRMKLNQKDGARTAYKQALAAFEAEAKAKKTEPQPVLQQVTTLALLGRVDEARALIEKLPTLFPDNRAVRTYGENKTLDRMIADPKFKELAL
jgi:tetratricopeptide (TPR) repeat protein